MYQAQRDYTTYPAPHSGRSHSYPAAYSGPPGAYPGYYPGCYSGMPGQPLLGAAVMGAVIGGTAAAGRNIGRVQRQEITTQEAVMNTLMAGATTGLVTAAAKAVASYFGGGPVTHTAAMFAAGTAINYLLEPAQ
jgi:hypothetical protein